MITDDAYKEVDNYYGDNYRKENGNIQDLIFHFSGPFFANTGLFEPKFNPGGDQQKRNGKNTICQGINIGH
jgi:hypothetical protein